MSNLEELVPPLDLCKQIPEGCFADSAMVYAVTKHSLNYCFGDRRCLINDYRELIPAPTLQEIIYELDNNADIWQDDDGIWSVFNYPYGHESGMTKDSPINPATAALKLWLELNKEGEK